MLKHNTYNMKGRPHGGGRSPETEIIVVEKWCQFPMLYKMTEVHEDRKENE